jgi:ligand-binding sensor domain-containing protein
MKPTFLDSIVIILLLSASIAGSQTWKSYTSTQEARVLLNDGNYLWIGTTGGLIKFDKISETHQLYTKDSGLSSSTIQCLHKDANDNLWVGTDNGLSMFDGSEWKSFYTETSDLPIYYIRDVTSDSDGNLYIAGGEQLGIFRQKYGGPTFARLANGTWENPAFDEFLVSDVPIGNCFDMISPGEFFCGSYHGLYYVTPTAWKELPIPAHPNLSHGPEIFDIAYHAQTNSRWIASDNGVFKIQNDEIVHKVSGDYWYYKIIIESPSVLWLLRGDGTVMKYDHGDVSSLSPPITGVFDILIDEEKTVWFAHSNGVSKKSGDDIRTYEFDSGLANEYLQYFDVDSDGNLWFIAKDKLGHFNGVEWTYFEIPYNVSPDNIYIDSRDRIWVFDGGKRPVLYFHNNIWNRFPESEAIQSMVETHNGFLWFGRGGHVLFRMSSDLQERQDFGDKINMYPPEVITSMLKDETTNDLWIGLGYHGGIIRLNLSDFATTYWDGENSILPGCDVQEIRRHSNGTIWAAIGDSNPGGLYYFKNNEWMRAPIDDWGWEREYISDLEIDVEGRIWFTMYGANTGGRYGGGLGLFDGQNWNQYKMHNSGIANNYATNLAINKNGDLWIATIRDGGISHFSPPKNSTSVDKQQMSSPDKFCLRSNYPNPFNPTTTISFDLAKDGLVTLKIYDITGRLLRVLVQEQKLASAHSILWDGLDDAGQKVAAGVYFYRIEFVDAEGDRAVKTRKMSILK